MMIRVQAPAVLPNEVKANLKGCFSIPTSFLNFHFVLLAGLIVFLFFHFLNLLQRQRGGSKGFRKKKNHKTPSQFYGRFFTHWHGRHDQHDGLLNFHNLRQ
jgi:hypothetical protein